MSTEDSTIKLLDDWLARGEITGDPDVMLIKREHLRFPTDEDFMVKPADQDDFPETYVRGYNISATGLGVISRTPIPRDFAVWVHSSTAPDADPWVPATIIHCTQTIGGFKVGLRFRL